jgi:membrane protease YdiL (CAAX protease family)
LCAARCELHFRSGIEVKPFILFNGAGRLRAVWRFALFSAAALFVAFFLLGPAVFFPLTALRRATGLRDGRIGYVAQNVVFITTAVLVGWLCCRFMEGLPLRSLGVLPRKGWMKDLLLGAVIGGLSIVLAAAVCTAWGSYTFMPAPAGQFALVLKTLVSSFVLYLLGAAWEEAVFRGYPLQTLMRSWPWWLALLPSSVLFAAIHLDNPNAVLGYTFVNTLLAGIWLAACYVRTRSLWLATGAHFGWNFTMGSLLGLPVSGITSISPSPLLRAADTGPTWLTGGHYGVEGGVACTLALVLSTLFVARTRWLSADEELKKMTDGENG